MKEKIFNLVSPFVELDICRIQQKLSMDSIHSAYFNNIKAKHPQMGEDLVEELANIKTTLHLLSAAYLNETRYKDPEFMKSLPLLDNSKENKELTSLTIDMRGNVTGDNWYLAEHDGRWAGPLADSSIIVPGAFIGRYTLEIDIVDELLPGSIDQLTFFVDDQPIPMNRKGKGLPCKLIGECELAIKDYPFFAVHMHYAGDIVSPVEVTRGENVDARPLVVRIKSISFSKVK